jgi:hypothetical protein
VSGLTLRWRQPQEFQWRWVAPSIDLDPLAVIIGPRGPKGAPGDQGDRGDVGPPGSAIVRSGILTSTTTLTPDADAYDLLTITHQNGNLTIADPTGSPDEGQRLVIKIRDNGVSIANISYGSAYISGGPAFVVSTTLGKLHTLGFIYDTGLSKWVLSAAIRQP